MAPPRLHLDADTSMKALHTALVARGYDVTRTPETWMARDATDTEQLLGATAQGRVLFTFNTHDFPVWRSSTRPMVVWCSPPNSAGPCPA